MDDKFLYGYGAIFGDIIGQPHEFPQANRLKTKDFRLFWEIVKCCEDLGYTVDD
jgi:ADP-ribosylglycohydrolase